MRDTKDVEAACAFEGYQKTFLMSTFSWSKSGCDKQPQPYSRLYISAMWIGEELDCVQQQYKCLPDWKETGQANTNSPADWK